MKLPSYGHLTYCSNIHPGETWPEVLASLQTHFPVVKQQVSPDGPMGIGLRLSNQASIELQKLGTEPFLEWMQQQGLYVFTMNGFPYGGFHRQAVKDKVYQPDWTTDERVEYTKRLFDLLAQMVPEGMDGGISTSPLSYKPWWTEEQLHHVYSAATNNLLKIVEQLHGYHQRQGITLHLDIEPEPDGLIENSLEIIRYFEEWLIPTGKRALSGQLKITENEVEKIIRRHVMVCYDVCHFAVTFESPAEVMSRFLEAGIGIGKIQLSSALKGNFAGDQHSREMYAKVFKSLDEPTYLHQVVARDSGGQLHQYQDLPDALNYINQPEMVEWRTHFHVPVFIESYGLLQSTQSDIQEVLQLWDNSPMTNHLEVETYTWEVLPEELQTDITTSIARELAWVIEQLK